MVRRFQPEVKRGSKLLYWIFILLIAAAWIWLFIQYFDRYGYLHPEITWAVRGVKYDTAYIDGVLIWKEVPVSAPASGTVAFPQGRGPVRVARGAVVARIFTGAKTVDIKAYQQGYFVAGLDGYENNWRYSSLWPGTDILPQPKKLVMLANDTPVGRGQFIGKIAEQPQELRFIGYADFNKGLGRQLAAGRLNVKMDRDDTLSEAEVRVSSRIAHKVKLYITLPWFRPEDVLSRGYTLILETGRTDGALIPESALSVRGKETGVFMVRGARVTFVPVEGIPAGNGKFLATKGLSVGDAVVENSGNAREGRIQLW